MDDVAVLIAEQLDLDVARPRQIALENKPVIAKSSSRLASSTSHRLVEILRALEDVHALAATAGAGLDEHRKPDPARLAQQLRVRLVRAVVSRQCRNAD